MWLRFNHLLWLVKLLAVLQLIKAKLIEPGDQVEQPVQYGCVNYDMANELLTRTKLIESKSDNIFLTLANGLRVKDLEHITTNITAAIKALLETQPKTSNNEFINESLERMKKIQTELHAQFQLRDSKLDETSLQVALTKILEAQKLFSLNFMNNQTIGIQMQLAELNNNLSSVLTKNMNEELQAIIRRENEAVVESLNNNAKQILQAELDEVRKAITTQSSKCGKTELQKLITESIENALQEQQKLLQQPPREENLKFSEQYLSSATGICNATNGLPENCAEALSGNPQCGEGVYLLYVPGSGLDPFYAYCLPDFVTPSSPVWTVIQRRLSGLYNFDRGWNDYRDGFGDVKSTYWLGLKYVHAMTSRRNYELWLDMVDWEGTKRYATYDKFVVGSEKSKFPLSLLGKYGGNAGDSLTTHAGQKFTTLDSDNDDRKAGNCAQDYAGGWWFYDCHVSNPNGIYNSTEYANGINWKSWRGYNYSYKTFLIAIRPRN